jgi:hypothetical protein
MDIMRNIYFLFYCDICMPDDEPDASMVAEAVREKGEFSRFPALCLFVPSSE